MPALTLLFFFFVCSASSQVWESYLISVKGDTINCVDKNKLKQGRWVVRVEPLRGESGYEEEGVFEDDKKEGPWRKYNLTGDLLAVACTGAYHHSMASNYNMVGRPPVVAVKNGRARELVRREAGNVGHPQAMPQPLAARHREALQPQAADHQQPGLRRRKLLDLCQRSHTVK